MPPNHAFGTSVAGRMPPQPPPRAPTFSSVYRAVTFRREKTPEVLTKEVFIPKYDLEWSKLKEFLDERFEQYKCKFTERFNVAKDKFVVNLPEDLTEADEFKIASLRV